MRLIIFFALMLSLFLAGGCASERLVFADEFNGPLDTNVWTRIDQGDAEWRQNMSLAEDLVEMREGCLVLVGRVNTDTNADARAYLTGGVWNLTAAPETMMTYGRVEIRAKFEDAVGAWPAFWMTPVTPDAKGRTWPWSGEIDIVERLNRDPFVYQTVHSGWTQYLKPKETHSGRGAFKAGAFNVFTLERTPDAIIWSVNGVETYRYERQALAADAQWPFTTPYFFRLDMQLGGGWVGKVDPATLPVRVWIDYIRVYERANP